MSRRGTAVVAAAMLVAGLVSALPAIANAAPDDRPGLPMPVQSYAVDFVATAAGASDMNDSGDVMGISRLDPGCGATCLPPADTVVWRDGQRIVLPTPPGAVAFAAKAINNADWIVGAFDLADGNSHAVVWRPVRQGYRAIDIGNLPGKAISTATGIDDLGRVVGWSTTRDFPPNGAPFVWTKAQGMVDLTTQGFPDELPIAVSSGGTVGTFGFTYRLDDPASIVALPPAPQGFVIGADSFAINDAGDEGRFLVSTGSENLLYLFRFHHEGQGTWQPLSDIPTGHLSSAGVGSINDAGDITATVQSSGMIAFGPDGLAQPFSPLVSSAYGGSAVTDLGPLNAKGQILAQMMIGRSDTRVVRLVPTTACATNCVRVIGIEMLGTSPARCGRGKDRVSATLKVVSETGQALRGVRITGHFLDDYWLDEVVTGSTDTHGQVTFKHVGPPCVGAVAFLVTDAAKAGRTLDRTAGILTEYVIPQP